MSQSEIDRKGEQATGQPIEEPLRALGALYAHLDFLTSLPSEMGNFLYVIK